MLRAVNDMNADEYSKRLQVQRQSEYDVKVTKRRREHSDAWDAKHHPRYIYGCCNSGDCWDCN